MTGHCDWDKIVALLERLTAGQQMQVVTATTGTPVTFVGLGNGKVLVAIADRQPFSYAVTDLARLFSEGMAMRKMARA